MKKMENNGAVYVLTAAVLYLVTGVLLLAMPGLEGVYLCYVGSGCLVAAGIIMIVRYFMMEAYQNINQYGFSIGVFAVVAGMCGLVKAADIAANLLPFLGVALLFTATVKLQYALDLKRLQNAVWPYLLGISLLVFLCAAIIIIRPFQNPEMIRIFVGVTLAADGVIGIASHLFLAIMLRKYEKGGRKQQPGELQKENYTAKEPGMDEEELHPEAGNSNSQDTKPFSMDGMEEKKRMLWKAWGRDQKEGEKEETGTEEEKTLDEEIGDAIAGKETVEKSEV